MSRSTVEPDVPEPVDTERLRNLYQLLEKLNEAIDETSSARDLPPLVNRVQSIWGEISTLEARAAAAAETQPRDDDDIDDTFDPDAI